MTAIRSEYERATRVRSTFSTRSIVAAGYRILARAGAASVGVGHLVEESSPASHRSQRKAKSSSRELEPVAREPPERLPRGVPQTSAAAGSPIGPYVGSYPASR